jgi:hypothetical protein
LRGTRLPIYLAAAVILILCAGCGWSSGEAFQGEYNPEGMSPVDTVQKWFASMEFARTENEEGEVVFDPEAGRDFDLYLQVVNPQVLQDPNGQFIGDEQVNALRELWNSPEWVVEFKNIELLEASVAEGESAVVEIVNGSIRYSGKDIFGSAEFKEDNFEKKKGEITLLWYDDPVNDPLQYIPEVAEFAGTGRWVVVKGFDFSEDEPWPEAATDST